MIVLGWHNYSVKLVFMMIAVLVIELPDMRRYENPSDSRLRSHTSQSNLRVNVTLVQGSRVSSSAFRLFILACWHSPSHERWFPAFILQQIVLHINLFQAGSGYDAEFSRIRRKPLHAHAHKKNENVKNKNQRIAVFRFLYHMFGSTEFHASCSWQH